MSSKKAKDLKHPFADVEHIIQENKNKADALRRLVESALKEDVKAPKVERNKSQKPH